MTCLLATMTLFVCNAPLRAEGYGVEVQVDREQLTDTDSLRLFISFTIEDQDKVAETNLPALGDFDTLSQSQGSSQQVSITMGSIQKRVVQQYQLVLRPRRSGNLTIEAATMKLRNGRQYRSKPIKISVLASGGGGGVMTQAGGTSPATPNNGASLGAPVAAAGAMNASLTAWEQKGGGLFLRAVASRPELFMGDQTMVSFYLYTNRRVSDVNITKRPSYLDAWTETADIGRRPPSQVVAIDGEQYTAFLLERVTIFPKKAGAMVIGPFEAEITTGGGFFDQGRSSVRNAQPFTLAVKPLPEDGRPSDFASVNVGVYRLEASLDRTETIVNEPVTLSLRIVGEGNIRALRPPVLESDQQFKVYPPTITEEIGFSNEGALGGTKKAELLILPQMEGTFTLPMVRFASFNPRTGQYDQQAAPVFSITVRPGAAGGGVGARNNQARPDADAEQFVAKLEPFAFNPTKISPQKPWAGSLSFYLALLAPLLLVFGGYGYVLGRWLRDRLLVRIRGTSAFGAQQALSAADAALRQGNTAIAGSQAAKALHESVRHATGVVLQGMAMDAFARDALRQAGLDEDLARLVLDILARLDAIRFAPSLADAASLATLIEETRSVVGRLLALGGQP